MRIITPQNTKVIEQILFVKFIKVSNYNDINNIESDTLMLRK